MKKVGIFSGTFDPVHAGHLAFARAALEKYGLDKVFFLVEPRPRRKQGVKAFEHRAEMVRLAIQGEPKFGSIVLHQQRFTYTETLPVLQRRFKGTQLHMLMGDDWLDHFADWPNVRGLTENISFIVGVRKNKSEAEQKIATIKDTRGLSMDYQLLRVEKPEFSSTAIRKAIKNNQAKDVVSAGLPPKVLDYIKENGLYASTTSAPASPTPAKPDFD